LLKYINKAATGLDRVVKFTVIIVTAAMFLILFMQMFARYVFTYSINWADGSARYLLCWMTFLAATVATREEGHIKITIISDRLAGKIKIAWEIFLNLFFLAITIFMIYYGFQISFSVWMQKTDALPISMGWVYLSIPISQVISGFYLIIIVIRDFLSLFVKEQGGNA